MAITKKPKATTTAAVNVEELISRGGSPGGKAVDTDNDTTAVVLRVPTAMLNQIDAVVKAQPLKTPRHRWMLEALYEKLSRHEKG